MDTNPNNIKRGIFITAFIFIGLGLFFYFFGEINGKKAGVIIISGFLLSLPFFIIYLSKINRGKTDDASQSIGIFDTATGILLVGLGFFISLFDKINVLQIVTGLVFIYYGFKRFKGKKPVLKIFLVAVLYLIIALTFSILIFFHFRQ